ncbi:hypothetical protein ABIA33_005496 [Streptacidiphilus sp. MAP12-16]|uniref:LytR C-terminal domain-containing protein n=1 Tax=Streptacidiphilus sp. MAP12-16 TaxID=3156300 RepID=UPI0035173AD3
MQRGRGTGAEPGGLGGVDAADLWVLDPGTGEYRMRLPGEPQRPTGPASATAGTTSPSPQVAAPARQPAGGRAARRRGSARRSRVHSGPMIAGVACFLVAAAGIGGYVLLRGGSSSAAGGPAAAAPRSAPSCTAQSSNSPTVTGPRPEPAVSGAFLNGAKAAAIDVRVTVLNGSGTFGQAESVLSWMQNTEHFLRTSNGGPAPATLAATTLVYAPDHVDQARTLAAAMGLPATALHGDGKGSGLRDPMVLTLGQDFHGIGKPFAAPSPAAPSGPANAAGGTGKAGCGSQ